MEAHTFLISFFTAHFKRHETKKFRSSYFLPPPTVIWGIIGAMFGIEREELENFAKENSLIVGAELCDFKGLATEKATLMPWDKENRIFIRTVEDFEFLIEPHYRIGIYAKENLIEELKEKIENKNFEFDIYGGISDCFLKDIKNEKKAEFMEKTEAKGMIPADIIAGFSQITEGSKIIRVLYLNTFFYQGFKVEFKVKEPIKTVNGIAVWSVDDVERFRKGNVE
ncbi:CRISPR-associated protein Cas5 [Thermodesulforhabdus norvegica]|uniref:CRISPR-associated protein Cas5, subtype I-B/HMARI n=1 Tax=Thermodesulforhabdus norvegica TaxID=39841 RepID=A0A1I4WFH1_9BACT|nr:CRISPR-associated protein Cas5 [Thermodesulforhabdus norvegica]SFN11936.1 CRISPR-associated protein Cas5, subtype I-B/HMARI [Thermodesulforhabdus norvegica]